ncbi:MAG: alpha/beta fold hydrolase [Sandaracinaceae bacterium]
MSLVRSVPRLVVALLIFASSGCQYGAYFFRATHEPMLALEVRMDRTERRSCVVVMMPGMLNVPDTYLDRGFVDDMVRASRRCDIVSADAHFGYYRHGTVAQRVHEDILAPARRRGYDAIWLVGSSMGAMGAMMVAAAHPDDIDGIVLLGPWFGEEPWIAQIEAAGGLAAWDPSDAPETPQATMWAWMQGYATHPDSMPPLFIAMGESDGMRRGSDLVGVHLPSRRYGLAEGGHEWDTWRVIWRRLLAHPPWDPGRGTPRIDR